MNNPIEGTKLRILQNEPAGKFFLSIFNVKVILFYNPNTYQFREFCLRTLLPQSLDDRVELF